jgi:hypothetical protein
VPFYVRGELLEVLRYGYVAIVKVKMTKPDFNQMSRQELRAYVLAHRDDDEAIEALIKRGNPDSPVYPFPQTDDDLKAMGEILAKKLGG